MKIVLAPDKFKGSLSASDAAQAMARGLRSVLPDVRIARVAIGDGGEGTARALAGASGGGQSHDVVVTGPLGASVRAHYITLAPDHTMCALDMASAAGLALVPADLRDPMETTTYGVGELIRAAAAHGGVRHIVIGLGGSATNDCGAGCLQALGFEILDTNGSPIPAPALPRDLARAESIVAPAHCDRLENVAVTLACDVDNPLVGPNGASHVYGPQKGAGSRAAIEELDSLLWRFGVLLDSLSPGTVPIAMRPGSGAAGGLGAALMAAFGHAAVRPGIEIVLDVAGFDSAAADAALVITGEGRLDLQTLSGKAVSGVLSRATSLGVAVAAIVGTADPDARDRFERERGLQIVEIAALAGSVDAAVAEPARWVENAAAQFAQKLL